MVTAPECALITLGQIPWPRIAQSPTREALFENARYSNQHFIFIGILLHWITVKPATVNSPISLGFLPPFPVIFTLIVNLTPITQIPSKLELISFLLIKKSLKFTPITWILALLTPLECHPISSSCCIRVKTLKLNTGKCFKQSDFNRWNEQITFYYKKMPNHVIVSDEIS